MDTPSRRTGTSGRASDQIAVSSRWPKATAARTTRDRGRRTIARLLDAAVAEFATCGYHGIRVGSVAHRAGTSHGTFYVYFADKDDLLVALIEDVETDLSVSLTAVPPLELGPHGREAVRQWVHDVSTVYQRHGAIVQAVNDAMTQDHEPKIARAVLRNLRVWTDVLADRIRAAAPVGMDPSVAALAVHATIEGANRGMFTGELQVEFDEMVDGLTEFVHRAVFGTELEGGSALP